MWVQALAIFKMFSQRNNLIGLVLLLGLRAAPREGGRSFRTQWGA